MKQLLCKTFFFLFIPLLLLAVAEAFLVPVNFFTSRTWEALLFSKHIPHRGFFFPGKHITMTESGDLGHHTAYAVPRKTLWITDELGYRNERLIPDADVMLIGDSYMVGTGLSQEQTLASVLMRKLSASGTRVYNLSPCSFEEFDALLQKGILKYPKVLVFSMVEKNIPLDFQPFLLNDRGTLRRAARGFKEAFITSGLDEVTDRLTRFYSFQWLQSRLQGRGGNGVLGKYSGNMMFMDGLKVKVHDSTDERRMCAILQVYKQYCDRKGIRFVYLPMPNKETVYYDLLPIKNSPLYLHHVDTLLEEAGIGKLNTLAIYQAFRKEHQALLYQTDDTHWSATAVELVADSLIRHPALKEITKP